MSTTPEVRHDIPSTMRAAWYTRNGPAADVLQVGVREVPAAGSGEVLVRVHTSGVNPSDWKVRKGGHGRPLAFPLVVPHSDGAGVVAAVGDGVDHARIGQRVWIWNGQWERPFGTAAQYIALPSAQAMPMPDGLSFEEAACLGIPAATALQAVRLAQLKPGIVVLIQGGAGSVGHYAIQLAKRRGATVVTTVSSEAKAAHARDAGADHVVDYRSEDVGARIRTLTGGRGVDAVIEVDFTTNAGQYPKYLRPKGTVVVYGMSVQRAELETFWFMRNQVTLRFVFIYGIDASDRAEGLEELQALLAAGDLKHAVAATLPLQEIARAHDMVERGEVIGNVVLRVP